MRIKLDITAVEGNTITANYLYPFSVAINKLLKFDSPEFNTFYQNGGYKFSGKKYDLYNFALRFSRSKYMDGKIILKFPSAQLFISTPLIREYMASYVVGSLPSQKMEIASGKRRTVFQISSIEILPDIEIKEEMKFRLISPVVLTAKDPSQRKGSPYLRYNDSPDELNWSLNNNLRSKYEMITGQSAGESGICFEWDKNLIKTLEGKGKRPVRKQLIKEGTPEAAEVSGSLLPFTIKGDINLIRIGYDCGFGEKNSYGFGMAELFT